MVHTLGSRLSTTYSFRLVIMAQQADGITCASCELELGEKLRLESEVSRRLSCWDN